MFEKEENTTSPLFQLKISAAKAKAYSNLMPLFYRLVQQNLMITEHANAKRHLEEDRLGDAQRIVSDLMMRRPEAMESLLAEHERTELVICCETLKEESLKPPEQSWFESDLSQLISEFGEDLTEYGVKMVTATIFREQGKTSEVRTDLKPQKSFVESFHYQD